MSNTSTRLETNSDSSIWALKKICSKQLSEPVRSTSVWLMKEAWWWCC